ncbi:MAG TPA: HAD-IIB family hydrolase, partial [Aeromicrobium sp.]|nr:HAD-IIB family hydrolase [Aeromicrobium sp.]
MATDLDGTLLRSDGTVSDRTRTALEGAWAAGISTVFVTARPPRWLDDLVDHVGDHGIAICGNGAFVYDVAEQQVIESRGFSTADLLTLAGDLRQEIPGIRFAVERADGMGSEDDYVYREETAGTTRGPLEELAATTVGKLLARSDEMSSEDFLRAVAGVVGDRANLGFSGAIGLAELTAPGVTKAAGLSIWCSEQGIGP